MNTSQHSIDVTYRHGTYADNHAAFLLLRAAFDDLLRRSDPQYSPTPEAEATAALHRGWQQSQSLFEHLTRSSEHFWVAESNGRMVGYARSTLRDGLRELTELFVHPATQAGGVGRALLERAFPREGARTRVVIAAPNPVAQVLYMRAGVYPRAPIAYFSREPESIEVSTELELRPLRADAGSLAALAAIDADVLGFRRDQDHSWLLKTIQGMLVLRDGNAVGYCYLGAPGGPWALLDPADFPAVLAYAEHSAAQQGSAFGVQVPLINNRAVDYLLKRGCRMNPSPAQLMSDQPFGSFDRYIIKNPMFFL